MYSNNYNEIYITDPTRKIHRNFHHSINIDSNSNNDYQIVLYDYGIVIYPNKDFISNAPGHIVVADEQKLRELKIKLDKIQEQLKSFS